MMMMNLLAVNVRQDLGTLLVGIPLRILIVVVIAAILQVIAVRSIHKIASRAIANAQRKRGVASETDGPAARTEQRAHAIGSLATSVVSLLIWTNAVLIILPLLGINITPILTSAGVAGIALAFGAQTLIKDYLSGIFMIVEDQFGVGDEVEMGGVIGTVEEVSLRTTRVRDADGVIWHLRNGEIVSVGNRSQL